MKKTIIALTIMVTMLLSNVSVFAATETRLATHPITKETKTITVQVADKPVTLSEKEALEKNFNFNGKYYPFGYWMGQTEAEAKDNFLDLYRNATKTLSQMSADPIKSVVELDLMWRAWTEYTLYGEIQDEGIYNKITKDILAKYPILTTGTDREKTDRQLEQIYALAQWLAKNTMYDDTGKGSASVTSLAVDIPTSSELQKMYDTTWSIQDPAKKYESYSKMKVLELARYKESYSVKPSEKYTGVCGSYALLAGRVLRQMGIEAVYVGSDTHAWNVVKMANGATVHLDYTDVSKGVASIAQMPAKTYTEAHGRYYSNNLKNKLTNSINIIKSGRLMAAMDYQYDGNSNFEKIPEGDIFAVYSNEEQRKEFRTKMNNLER